MVSFTYTTVVAVSILSLVAPSIQGGMIVKAGASLVGGLLGGNHKREAGEPSHAAATVPGHGAAVPGHAGAAGHSGAAPLAGLDAASLASIKPLFDSCMKSLKEDKAHSVHLNKVSKEAQMSGLKPDCIAGAKKAKALPNWATIAKEHGDIRVINEHTLGFTGIDSVVDELLKSDGAAPATSANHAEHAAAVAKGRPATYADAVKGGRPAAPKKAAGAA